MEAPASYSAQSSASLNLSVRQSFEESPYGRDLSKLPPTLTDQYKLATGDGRTVYARETQHGSAAFYTVHKWMSEKDQHKLSNEERGKVMKQYYKDFDALSGEKQQEYNAT